MQTQPDDGRGGEIAGRLSTARARDGASAAPGSNPVERVLYEVKKTIVGQDVLLERLLVALLSRGHILVEGGPGLAKTLAVKSLAAAIGGQFHRVQFTPDLVPADIVGTRVYNQRSGEFQVSLGPVFTNLLLADEINRAPAKVQSALLEAMQERQVTIGKDTHPLGALRRPRDREPDRDRRNLPAPRSPARPLHVEGARRLPLLPGRGRRRGADHRSGDRASPGGDARPAQGDATGGGRGLRRSRGAHLCRHARLREPPRE